MRACLIRRLRSWDSREGHVWQPNSSRETQSDTEGWLPSPAASSGLQGVFLGIRGILGARAVSLVRATQTRMFLGES
jgi:hypothetical protein